MTLSKKIYLGYIWHKSFIQTIKCSFFNQIIVCQSFYGAPLTFSYFLLQGIVLSFARIGKSVARCLLSEAVWRPCQKSYISGYIWHKSFIETVKCSFFNQIIVNQGFYGAALTLSNYSGFRRKARVIKCNRFPREKGGHGPRRSMRRLRKLGTRNTTLLACDRKFWQVSRHKRSSRIQRCRSFSERVGPRIIFFKASQVSSCSKRQFSWDNNWADRMWLVLF